MRAVAMKLHTKEQAPKEGGIEAPKPVKAVRAFHLQQPSANGLPAFNKVDKKLHTAQQ
jgi:hypothetical protein